MSKIKGLLIVFTIINTALFAQDNEIRPAALGFSLINNDYLTAYRIRHGSLSNVIANNKIAKYAEMDKGLALHYFKGLHKHIDFDASLYGLKTKDAMGIGSYSKESFLLGINAAANFKLVSEKYWIQPYLIYGIGAQMFDKSYFGAYFYPGLGMKFNFADKVHLFMSGQYNIPVTPATLAHHFNRQIGLAFSLGKKRTPLPPPPPPPVTDSDNDGIPDTIDACPNQPGTRELNGCPDRDGDGIADKDDACPDQAGLAALQGCPDGDGDGITDKDDACPDQAGLAALQGCPDRDSDGIPDKDDRCPTLAGPASNNGCPEVKEEVKKRIEEAAKAIYFVTNGDKLEKRSYPALNKILAELKNDMDLKLDIAGHTDNVGSSEYNQGLSERRAKAVYDWLVNNGIDASRLASAGYGEDQPVADNATAKGRQLNRRTEMKLHYD